MCILNTVQTFPWFICRISPLSQTEAPCILNNNSTHIVSSQPLVVAFLHIITSLLILSTSYNVSFDNYLTSLAYFPQSFRSLSMLQHVLEVYCLLKLITLSFSFSPKTLPTHFFQGSGTESLVFQTRGLSVVFREIQKCTETCPSFLNYNCLVNQCDG